MVEDDGTSPDASTEASAGPHAEQVAAVQQGYGVTGAVLELGSLVVDAGGVPTPRPDAQVRIPPAMPTRHGLVAGATWTGKPKTLQVMAEQLSAHGVPVLMADIKGDLSGVAVPGTADERLTARTRGIGQHWRATAFPTEFLALGGLGTGVPVRASTTAFGPDLLAEVLDLDDTQTSAPPAPTGDPLPGPGQSRDDVEPAPRTTPSRRPSPRPRAASTGSGPVGEALASPAVKSLLRSAGSVLGREITRGLFGTARRRR